MQYVSPGMQKRFSTTVSECMLTQLQYNIESSDNQNIELLLKPEILNKEQEWLAKQLPPYVSFQKNIIFQVSLSFSFLTKTSSVQISHSKKHYLH